MDQSQQAEAAPTTQQPGVATPASHTPVPTTAAARPDLRTAELHQSVTVEDLDRIQEQNLISRRNPVVAPAPAVGQHTPHVTEVAATVTPAPAVVAPPATPTPATPVPEPPVAQPPVVTPPAAAAPEAPAVPGEVPPGTEADLPQRFRVTDPKAVAWNSLVRSGMSGEEASRRIYGDGVIRNQVVAPAQPVAPPAPTAQERIAKLEQDAQTIKAKLASTRKEDPFSDALDDITDELATKRAEIQTAKAMFELAQQDKQARLTHSFNQAQQGSMSKAVEYYPQLSDAGSELTQAVNRRIDEIKANPEHPDHGMIHVASAPLAIASQVAMELGIERSKVPTPASSPAAQPPAAAAPTTVPQPPQRIVSPPIGNPPAAVPPQSVEKQTLERLRTTNDVNDLDMLDRAQDRTGFLTRTGFLHTN